MLCLKTYGIFELPRLNLCYYANCTDKIQILKVREGQKIGWERVVFPQERIFFYAQPDEQLEISCKMANDITKIENISCQYLLVLEEPNNQDLSENANRTL